MNSDYIDEALSISKKQPRDEKESGVSSSEIPSEFNSIDANLTKYKNNDKSSKMISKEFF